MFRIDPQTGEISLIESLTTLNTFGATLVIQALDSSNADSAIRTELKLEIFDEPNAAPKFSDSVYNVSLSDETQQGDFVLQVFADDSDPGPYGEVTYRILNDNSGKL